MSKMPGPGTHKLFYIRMTYGETPRTKAAAIEAMTACPESVLLVATAQQSDIQQSTMLNALAPGQTIAYTDGQGRYYGTVTKPQSGAGFLFDAKPETR